MRNPGRLTVEAVASRTDLTGGKIHLVQTGEFGRIVRVRMARLFGKSAVRVSYAPGFLDDSFVEDVVVAPGLSGHRVAKNRLGRVRLLTKRDTYVLIPRDHPSLRRNN